MHLARRTIRRILPPAFRQSPWPRAAADFLCASLAVWLLPVGLVSLWGVLTSDPHNPQPASILATPPAAPANPATTAIQPLEVQADRCRLATESAASRLSRAENAAAAAWLAFNHFLSQHFDDPHRDSSFLDPNLALPPAQSAPLSSPPDPAPPFLADSPPQPTLIPNPRWQELKQKLDALVAERTAFLETLTPSHPKILALDAAVFACRQQLDLTERRIPSNPDDEESPALHPPATIPSPHAQSPQQFAADQSAARENIARRAHRAEQYRSLSASVEQAERELRAASEFHRACCRKLESSLADLAVARGAAQTAAAGGPDHVETSPQEIQPSPADRVALAAWLALVPALAAGWLVARFGLRDWHQQPSPDCVLSTDQLAELLSLPAHGCLTLHGPELISAAHLASAPTPPPRPWIAGIRFCARLVVAAAFAFLVAMSLGDPDWVLSLFAHPSQTAIHTLTQICQTG